MFSAIYLNEYAKDTFFTRIIRTSINNLAGVPSIVFGLFGLGFFILFIGKNLDEVLQTGLLFGQPALLWASATLAVLVLPIVIVSTLEALKLCSLNHIEMRRTDLGQQSGRQLRMLFFRKPDQAF